MGMAASQARLLSITSRMADNELRAQIINNSKMRLTSESSRVSEEYINALNSATMMISNYDIDGNSQYQKLSYNALTSYSSHNNQYGLINANGQILVSETEADFFKQSNGDLTTYLGYHNLEYTSRYFTKDTLGADSIDIQGTNENSKTKYDIGNYTIADLKIIYEGGVDSNGIEHLGYNNCLQSSEYLNFYDYYDQYLLANDNYLLAIAEEVNGELLGTGGKINGSDDFDSYYSKYCTNASSQSVSDLCTKGVEYINQWLDKLLNEGKLSSSAGTDEPNTWYDDMKAIIESIDYSNGSVTLHDTDKVTTNSDGSFNLGTKYVLDDGSTTFYDFLAVKTTSGYKVSVTQDAINYYSDDEGAIGLYDTNGNKSNEVTLASLSDFKYYISETETDEEGNAVQSDTVYSYKYTPGDKYATVSWKATDEEVQDLVSSLFITYRSSIANVVNKDVYGADLTESTPYNAALENLIGLIFGEDVAAANTDENKAFYQLLKNNAANLNDIGWIMSNYPDKTADNFQVIKDIYILDALFNIYGEPSAGWIDTVNASENADAKVQWYTNLFNRMEQGYKALEDGLASSNEWIQFALESGLVSMIQVDKTNNWTSTIYSNCSDITEVTDDVAVTKAEAEYNKAMNNIESKDQRYDIELKNIDTEHSSLQTEYDSVKSVIDSNIERTFKMYS